MPTLSQAEQADLYRKPGDDQWHRNAVLVALWDDAGMGKRGPEADIESRSAPGATLRSDRGIRHSGAVATSYRGQRPLHITGGSGRPVKAWGNLTDYRSVGAAGSYS